MSEFLPAAAELPATTAATAPHTKREPTLWLRRQWWPEFMAVALAIGVWQVGAMLLDFPLLPPFSAVLAAWVDMVANDELLQVLVGSLGWWFMGFVVASIVGVAAGLLAGVYPRVAYIVDPIVDINLATPTLIYVPVLFALFGTGNATRVATVFLYAFPIIAANVAAGVRYADPSRIEMARAFNATQRQIFRFVILPDSLPMTMSGLRIGANRGIKGMVNGEMMIALVGLGARLRRYGGAFDMDRLLAVLLTVVVVAVVISTLLQRLDRRLTGWSEAIQTE